MDAKIVIGTPIDFLMDVKSFSDKSGEWIVEGFCATSDVDLVSDLLSEEALRKSVEDLKINRTVLRNHIINDEVGVIKESEFRENGIWVKVLVSKTRPDIWTKIVEGVLNKFSVKMKIEKAEKRIDEESRKSVNFVTAMKIVEVSLVSVPMNEKARVLRWYVEKALADVEGEKDMQNITQKDIQGLVDGIAKEKGLKPEDVLKALHTLAGVKEKAAGDPPPEAQPETEGAACNMPDGTPGEMHPDDVGKMICMLPEEVKKLKAAAEEKAALEAKAVEEKAALEKKAAEEAEALKKKDAEGEGKKETPVTMEAVASMLKEAFKQQTEAMEKSLGAKIDTDAFKTANEKVLAGVQTLNTAVKKMEERVQSVEKAYADRKGVTDDSTGEDQGSVKKKSGPGNWDGFFPKSM